MLVKALPGNHKAVLAVYYMTLIKKPGMYLRSKEFERLRKIRSEIQSQRSKEMNTGRTRSEETKQKMSQSRLDLLETRPDLKEMQSIRNLGNKYNLGKKNSDETKAKRTASWKRTVADNPKNMESLLERNKGNKYAEGCKWMHHPEKQLTTLVPSKDVQMRLSHGWFYGRKKFKKAS
ncbi:putative homing endonuclease protein [Rhizobium phage RHph_TM61]|nr:putative homing endonuclease protein [Rhizobium phage RHph_TM61]